MSTYRPEHIEEKWQRFWEEQQLFTADESSSKPKKYILSMFPYPSGALHMGHVMNYTISDVMVRYATMQGFNVLSPIGWDSFGLPAENAAIREGIHPSENIHINITKMRKQMKRAGWGFDWQREVATSSPEYYRWTQWLFLQFYKAGLAQKKTAAVNWCPNDMTVLANEQVHEGRCERCGTPVEQRDLEQWFFTMSAYAQKLLDSMDSLTQWPERVIKMQREWIGRSEGARVRFALQGGEEQLEVFTTRPDTLFGVSFIAMAPQHPLIESLIAEQPNREQILAMVKKLRAQGTSELEMLNKEKEGIFTGRYVINPVNGEEVPLWVANFALMSYGTGVVMSVPAHDQRDFEFAQKYDLPLRVVIQPEGQTLQASALQAAYVDNGTMVNSGPFDGRNNREAMSGIIEWIDKNSFGARSVNYRLRDWLLSRQRYWGAPIPIVYCDSCGMQPVPEDQLPVLLPDSVEFKPTGESPLKTCPDFINTTCPRCGGAARRDPDTMDTFVDSSWYYLRYASPHHATAPFSPQAVAHWCPIDTYIGGIEHATMHLIYFRFFAQVLNELGLVDFTEPVHKLFCQGMVCKEAYYCEVDKWLSEEQVVNGCCSICGAAVSSEMTKMSKTKLNVVSPEAIIERFGADTMRTYILSDTPPDRDQMWNDEGVAGISRFLNRVWETISSAAQRLALPADPTVTGEDKAIRFITHQTIERCRQAYEESWQFNTAIARIIELLNAIRKAGEQTSAPVLREACEALLQMLAPMAPHMAEELWQQLGHTDSIFHAPLPQVDQSALLLDEITIVVQINGKLRDQFTAPRDIDTQQMQQQALSLERIQKYLQGLEVKKVIPVPGKLVNIVAR